MSTHAVNTTSAQERLLPPCTPRVPQDAAEREALIRRVDQRVAARKLTPPMPLEDLQALVEELQAEQETPPEYQDFLTVAVGNAIWRDTVAAVPCNRRILLLPQCLRNEECCPARYDRLGLLCENCGQCAIGRLQAEAEELGYVVLVAEGTTVVTQLLEQGQVDAVIGVSCLDVFERAFPYMLADAIPGIAVPLLQDGCRKTRVDEVWLGREMRRATGDAQQALFDLSAIQDGVHEWFAEPALKRLMGHEAEDETSAVAQRWLHEHGKRWRPFLTAAVYRACVPGEDRFPDSVIRLALAVECFHKASLIHDDIEDNDDERYGAETLHRRYGIPTALNVGDYLLGEGYAQIARTGLPETALLTAVAAQAHKTLCLGQGEELSWMRQPEPPSVKNVLRIFARKTAPAFDVALRLGALAGALDAADMHCLGSYSRALGIAYQIQDDLGDGHAAPRDGDLAALRPSLLVALACESAPAADQAALAALIRGQRNDDEAWQCLRRWASSETVRNAAQQHFEHHRNQTLRCIAAINNTRLKLLLQRLTNRILMK